MTGTRLEFEYPEDKTFCLRMVQLWVCEAQISNIYLWQKLFLPKRPAELDRKGQTGQKLLFSVKSNGWAFPITIRSSFCSLASTKGGFLLFTKVSCQIRAINVWAQDEEGGSLTPLTVLIKACQKVEVQNTANDGKPSCFKKYSLLLRSSIAKETQCKDISQVRNPE